MSVTASIVLEWETVLEGKRDRGIACLRSIHRQLCESGAPVELVVCFDGSETDEGDVRAALEEAAADAGGAPRAWPGKVIVATAPRHLDYYQKKNYGFTLTSGDVVVFLDSDLEPEPDWLQRLLAPFEDFRKSVVVGRTYLETRTLYERAVALFWIFDTRDERPELSVTGRLVSNNIAFRRSVFSHFPFPDRPSFRGQCSELGSILDAHAVAMYEQPAARARHPAPDGARRFFARSLHAGADHCFYDTLAQTAGVRRAVSVWRTDVSHVIERIARRRSFLNASRGDALAGLALGLLYYTTKSAGYCMRLSHVGRASARPAASL